MRLHYLILIVLLLSACSSATPPNSSVPVSGVAPSPIEAIKESAKAAISSPVVNATTQAAEQSTQTVFVPLQSSQGDIVSANYVSPCLVEKFKVLNIYCGFKNFWHNQSKLISWYVPYSVIFFLLIVFVIWVWIKSRNG